MNGKLPLLHIELPPYPAKGSLPKATEDPRPKIRWRRDIHSRVLSAKKSHGFEIARDEPLAVEATILLSEPQFKAIDVDNLLKDALDALQGRLAGESKGTQRHKRVLVNDHQIVRVSVEKLMREPESDHGGIILLKRLPHASSR